MLPRKKEPRDGRGELGMTARRTAAFAWVAAVVAVLAVVASATAGKNPEGTLVALLDEVTQGHNAAFTSTFSNTGKTQTHAEFHSPIPTGNHGPVYASCPYTLTATELVCNSIKLDKGEIGRVTIVWLAFDSDYSAYWTTDSGSNSPTKPKKRFDVGPAHVELIGAGDASKASSYVLSSCNPNPTLETNPDVSPDNPLATRVCVPAFAPQSNLLPGLKGIVEETDVDEQFPQQSEICLAVLSCDHPFTFSTPIVFTFFLDEGSFVSELTRSGWHWHPHQSPITQVFHDDVLVPSCDDEDAADLDPCVKSLKSDGYGTTTVVARGTDNGDWRFG
jgi:hypothetical protein